MAVVRKRDGDVYLGRMMIQHRVTGRVLLNVEGVAFKDGAEAI
jgi:hypothetical protein